MAISGLYNRFLAAYRYLKVSVGTWKDIGIDRTERIHNAGVGGSSPPIATIKSLKIKTLQKFPMHNSSRFRSRVTSGLLFGGFIFEFIETSIHASGPIAVLLGVATSR